MPIHIEIKCLAISLLPRILITTAISSLLSIWLNDFNHCLFANRDFLILQSVFRVCCCKYLNFVILVLFVLPSLPVSLSFCLVSAAVDATGR
jgi:hypothetical protein